MIHAAPANVDVSGVVRLSTDIRYQRADEPIDWRWDNHWHDQDGLCTRGRHQLLAPGG